MAGPLTWRDVSAPDFSASMQGIGQFSQMLENALGGADKALTEWDNTKTDKVSKEFMLDLFSKYDTPEKFAAAQADGSLMEGMDTSRLNAPAMEFLFGRPNALLDTQGKQLTNQSVTLDNKIKKEEFGWKTDDRNAVEAAKPYAFKMLETVSAPGKNGGAPTDAEVAERMAILRKDPQFATVMSNLKPGDQMLMYSQPQAVLKSTLGITSDRQGLRQNDLNYEKGVWEFQASKADRADQTAGMAAAQEAIEGGGGDIETARSILAKKNLTPGAFAVAMNQVSGTYGNVYSPESYGGDAGATTSGTGGNTGPGGLDPTRVMNYQARAVGFNVVPPEVKTLGQARQFAKKVNAAGADSSAMGLYQIVGKTMEMYGPKVFGAGWKNVEFSPQNQDKLARAIFEDNKHSARALRGQWASLSPANAERIRKMPWEQARLEIMRLESGGNAGHLSGVPNGQRDDLDGAVAISQSNTVRNSKGWAEKLNDGSNANQVASALTGGPLKGAPVPWVAAKLNDIVRRSGGKLNYAQAGSVLHDAMTKDPDEFSISGAYGRNAPRILGGNFGDARDQINESFIDQRIDDAKSGRFGDQTRTNTQIEQAAGAKQRADAEYQAAWAERQKYIRAVQTNPKSRNLDREAKINARLDVAIQNRNAAFQNYDMIVNTAGGGTAPVAKPVKKSWGDMIGGLFTIHRD